MKVRQRPRNSLRTLLVFWLLVFSIAPLAIITWYSLRNYEQGIEQELSARLLGNAREISVILSEYQNTLSSEAKDLATDKALNFFLLANKFSQMAESVEKWLKASVVSHRIWLFNRDGQVEVALKKDARGNIVTDRDGQSMELTDERLKEIKKHDQHFLISMPSKDVLELSLFMKMRDANSRITGFVEKVIRLDSSVLKALGNRMNAEIFFFEPSQPHILATHEDLALYKAETFLPQIKDGGFFELNIRGVPYHLMIREMTWGESKFYMGLGVSKSSTQAVLKKVSVAFYSVVGAVIVLLVFLSIWASRLILRPIFQVLEAIQSSDFESRQVEIPVSSNTELGLLVESFNDLSKRTFESQKALRDKIGELEKANQEIRETQAKLVHTAKMASLGQLVAGVAHELNNPIGFIYSNMTHLKEYSEKLMHLIDVAQESPKSFEKEKKKADLDYIRTDLPKLITSCEDGAKRTRDIVLGLRNFSRLEEAQLKDVDIHEGLENTLRLLSGELKNRIRVEKTFARLPKVTCYPSQLNQVFMNILSNAAQAIDGEGEIEIQTKKINSSQVEIRIKDSGKGMPKNTLEKIFDPFFTTKSLGSGTGLGLSISYGVIQKHGGDILVSSEPGQGTEFRIILPIDGPSDRKKPA